MKRWTVRCSLALALAAMLLLLSAWLWMRASLPRLEGEHALAGLDAAVTLHRDEFGVATIVAGSDIDLARANGFLHGQERFFQMDLLRRSAAGELSALVGAAALDYDRKRRIHDFRNVARQAVAAMPEEDRDLLGAYATGVNAGLETLGVRPFEYGLLRLTPTPWRPEDSLLVVYAMYFDLHDEDARRERFIDALHDLYPQEFVNFLVPRGTPWDAPIAGGAFMPSAIPSAAIVDFRGRAAVAFAPAPLTDAEHAPGSNSWAVDGARSATGAAMVANDMHLGLRVPNIWFRLRLENHGADPYHVTGVSLPGVPGVVAGSNGHIAWSFTNSYGDWIDLVRLEVEACEQGYLTPAGCEPFETVTEEIEVAHGGAGQFNYRRTRWGPVVESGNDGGERIYALRWTAHDPEATNINLRRLATTRTLDDALAIAQTAGMPPQNLVVGDRTGAIAWSIIGRIPRRTGHDGLTPLASSETNEVWEGWLQPHEYPVVRNPPHGRLWSANARMVDGEAWRKLGDGGYSLGARAAQIRDRLFEQDRFDADAMLRIQLDDEARFLARWQQLMLNLLDDAALEQKPQRRVLRDAITDWEGRAGIDSVSYRVVRTFRDTVLADVIGGLTAEASSEFPGFGFGALTQSEGPLWVLITEQPAHLLPPGHANWRTLLLQSADKVHESLSAKGDISEWRWGARNTARIDHPLGQLPLIGLLLNASRVELPGDIHMPRVQGPAFGASERFVVSPGHEDQGYFHMPGGQSGHPLSPFYLAAQDKWAQGEPAPFLPAAPRYTLQLLPKKESE